MNTPHLGLSSSTVIYPHFIHGETEVPHWLVDGETQLVSDGAKTEIQSCLAHSISLAGPDQSPNHTLPESWGCIHSSLHPPRHLALAEKR